MTRTKSSRALLSVVLAVLMAAAFMPSLTYSSFAATAKKATKVTKASHADKSSFTRTVGTAWTLKYKLSPSKLTSSAKKVVWKSSNSKVAKITTIKSGKAVVSFKSAGSATVTVYTKANTKAKTSWKFKVVNAAKKVAATGVTVKANNSTDYTKTLSVGTVLTATATPANATGVTYQWYADGTAIDGATSSQFTVTSDQIGKKITVKAKANTGDEVTSAESAAVAEVKIDNLKLTGTPKIGETLTVTGTSGNSTMSDAVLSNSVDVQWYRYKEAANGNKVDEAISGATGTTYKVTDADAGYQLYAVVTPKTGVKVSNTINGYKDGKVTLTKSSKVAAANTSITGVKIQVNGKDLESGKTYDAGTTLTAVVDPTGAANAVDYQWYQNGYKINGATSATYTAATSGSYTVKITLKSTEMTYGFANKATVFTSTEAKVNASKSFSSTTLTNVTAANDSTRTDKTVTYVNDKLGVEVSGVATTNYNVQWHKISKDSYGDPVDTTINNATNTTYTVSASDVAVGDQVYAVVTGKTGTQYADYSGKTSTLTISKKASSSEPVVTGVTVSQDTNKKTVSVNNLPTGEKVQLQKQTVSGIGVESAWTDISGATSTTYELTTDDLAAITAGTVKVRAKITDASGNLVGYTTAITLK